jgi:hypothetical protein
MEDGHDCSAQCWGLHISLRGENQGNDEIISMTNKYNNNMERNVDVDVEDDAGVKLLRLGSRWLCWPA